MNKYWKIGSLVFISFLPLTVYGQVKLIDKNVGKEYVVYCQTDNDFMTPNNIEIIKVIPTVGSIINVKKHSFTFRLDKKLFRGKIGLKLITRTRSNEVDTSNYNLVFKRDYTTFPYYEFVFGNTLPILDTVHNRYLVKIEDMLNNRVELFLKRNGVLDTTIKFRAIGLIFSKGTQCLAQPFFFGHAWTVCGYEDPPRKIKMSACLKRTNIRVGDRIFIEQKGGATGAAAHITIKIIE